MSQNFLMTTNCKPPAQYNPAWVTEPIASRIPDYLGHAVVRSLGGRGKRKLRLIKPKREIDLMFHMEHFVITQMYVQ